MSTLATEAVEPTTAPRLSTASVVAMVAPAAVLGLVIRWWLAGSNVMTLNSDEAVTGLQARDALRGTFHLMVAGNSYGSTTESYLAAPGVWLTSSALPLRIVPILMTALTCWVMYRLAQRLIGMGPAIAVALVYWVGSGAIVVLSMRPYMGYTTGVLFMVWAMERSSLGATAAPSSWKVAFLCGLAVGLAAWSHPMFGVVAGLAAVVPTARWIREVRFWLLPAAVGGLVGLSPWLLYIARNGKPVNPASTAVLSYPDRVRNIVTAILPRGFGVREMHGEWLGPDLLTKAVLVGLLVAALGGAVVLVRARGWAAAPLLVIDVMAIPALALFPQLTFADDGRYALPFFPALILSIAGLAVLLPERARRSVVLMGAIPVIWGLLLCVPVLNTQVDWSGRDADQMLEQAISVLDDAGIDHIAGDYWLTYNVSYLSDGEILAKPDYAIRFPDDASQVESAGLREIAFLYPAGHTGPLPLPLDQYTVERIDNIEIFLPR